MPPSPKLTATSRPAQPDTQTPQNVGRRSGTFPNTPTPCSVRAAASSPSAEQVKQPPRSPTPGRSSDPLKQPPPWKKSPRSSDKLKRPRSKTVAVVPGQPQGTFPNTVPGERCYRLADR